MSSPPVPSSAATSETSVPQILFGKLHGRAKHLGNSPEPRCVLHLPGNFCPQVVELSLGSSRSIWLGPPCMNIDDHSPGPRRKARRLRLQVVGGLGRSGLSIDGWISSASRRDRSSKVAEGQDEKPRQGPMLARVTAGKVIMGSIKPNGGHLRLTLTREPAREFRIFGGILSPPSRARRVSFATRPLFPRGSDVALVR